jgi:signal transduction histidine kinase/PAS domain-containing protein
LDLRFILFFKIFIIIFTAWVSIYFFLPFLKTAENKNILIKNIQTIETFKLNTLRELMHKERFLLTGDSAFIDKSLTYEKRSKKIYAGLTAIADKQAGTVSSKVSLKNKLENYSLVREKFDSDFREISKNLTPSKGMKNPDVSGIAKSIQTILDAADKLEEQVVLFNESDIQPDNHDVISNNISASGKEALTGFLVLNLLLSGSILLFYFYLFLIFKRKRAYFEKALDTVCAPPYSKRMNYQDPCFKIPFMANSFKDGIFKINRLLEIINIQQNQINEIENNFKKELLSSRQKLIQEKNKLKDSAREVLYIKEYYEGIVESITDGIIVLDRDGTIVSLNSIAKAYFTSLHKGPDIYGQDFLSVIAAENRGALGDISICLKNAAALLKPQRTRFFVKSSCYDLKFYPSIDKSGKYSGAIIVMEDKTSLIELERRVNRVERLASLGQLSAGVAHEIKNPLAGMQVTAELLLESMDEKSPQALKIKAIQNEITRLDNIVNSLLDFARPAAMTGSKCRPCDVLEKVFKFLQPSLKSKGITGLIQKFDSKECLIDESSLQQVFLNIFNNAAEAMENNEKGLEKKLTVRVEQSPQSNVIKLYIQNTGPKITDDIAERIFDPFFTTRPSGTGLGLSIIHNILTEAGGSISLGKYEDIADDPIINKDMGAVFIVTLPLA